MTQEATSVTELAEIEAALQAYANAIVFHEGVGETRAALVAAVLKWGEEQRSSTSVPVMNPPAQAEARNRNTALHDQRTQTPRADDSTGVSSGSEARPVTATELCKDGEAHVGYYFCKKCGKDLTPNIEYADAPNRRFPGDSR